MIDKSLIYRFLKEMRTVQECCASERAKVGSNVFILIENEQKLL